MNTNFIFGDYSGKLLNLMIKYSNLNDFIAILFILELSLFTKIDKSFDFHHS